MNYDYVIRLRRPNYRGVDLISQFLLVLYLIVAVRAVLVTGVGSNLLFQLAFPVMILVLWILNLTKRRGMVVYYRLPLLLASVGWVLSTGGWTWMSPLYVVIAWLEPQVKFPDEIGFTREKIVRNTFPRKTYEWVDIDSVMIRNNLFTLDLRNNKLIQKELETPVDPELQREFNDYCRNQLHFTTPDATG